MVAPSLTVTDTPGPDGRLPESMWCDLRTRLLAEDPDAESMRAWAESLGAASTSVDDLAHETIWIILCAGKKAQAARTIETRVLKAMAEGRPVIEAYGHRGRAAAIEAAWAERAPRHEGFLQARTDPEVLYLWCQSLAWVGPVTAFQLMKNLGVDCCKPDIWLCRLAGIPDSSRLPALDRFRACQALCKPLAKATGDRLATVDSLLWLACNKGLLRVGPDAGPVTVSTSQSRHGSIYGDAAPASDLV